MIYICFVGQYTRNKATKMKQLKRKSPVRENKISLCMETSATTNVFNNWAASFTTDNSACPCADIFHISLF